MDLFKISNGKYKFKDKKINGGAFSKIYDIENKINKKNNYIVKIHKYKYRKEAINEIDMLLKLKKNKNKFKENLKKIFNNDVKISSKLLKIKDYYITNDYIITVFKKYNITLDDFNIQYNKMFNETLPISVIKKLFNSLFLGLYELHFSKLIHCDIKPNNILIELTKYKNINALALYLGNINNNLTNTNITNNNLNKFKKIWKEQIIPWDESKIPWDESKIPWDEGEIPWDVEHLMPSPKYEPF